MPLRKIIGHLIYKAQCVCVCVSGIEIQTIRQISMKFETVEDHDPEIVFM
jgi:hypothetical protein